MAGRDIRIDEVLAALGNHQVTTAQQLAASIKVSERTIYRYIKDLRAGGAPIQGEAGMGFQLKRQRQNVEQPEAAK